MRKRLVSPQARRWIVFAAVLLLLIALVLLGYALLPGSEPLRLQSTLDPTLIVAPAVLP